MGVGTNDGLVLLYNSREPEVGQARAPPRFIINRWHRQSLAFHGLKEILYSLDKLMVELRHGESILKTLSRLLRLRQFENPIQKIRFQNSLTLS